MSVQIILLTELVSDGNAGEVLAPVTLYRVNVEENGKSDNQSKEDQQEDQDLEPLTERIRMPKTRGRNKVYCYSFNFTASFEHNLNY